MYTHLNTNIKFQIKRFFTQNICLNIKLISDLFKIIITTISNYMEVFLWARGFFEST
jgi:hypothetical protein